MPTQDTKTSRASLKPKSIKYGVSKECVEFLKNKGYVGLNVYPQSFVSVSEIVFNKGVTPDNQDTMWVCKFPAKLPDGTTTTKTAYTRGYMKNSQTQKYKKISKISVKDIGNLEEKTQKFMGNKDVAVADAACVLRIILKTGLRVGSSDNNRTGNVGVRTLLASNVKISGSKIRLSFIGKSYQENIAQFEDSVISEYLSKKINNKLPTENVFSCSYDLVGKLMRRINPKEINPKDLRTYKATAFAKELLDKTLKDPLPDNPKEIKKTVKQRLITVFQKVSEMLNNSPGMAKNSYIQPKVITDYLKILNLKPALVGYKHITLESILYETEVPGIDNNLLPDWWDDENINLVPIN